MPWKEVSVMSERIKFIKEAIQPGANISQLCEHYEISRKTGYKWLRRYRMYGTAGLVNRSKQPKLMPRKTPQIMEQAVLEVRNKHPAWGGRKIHTRLKNLGQNDVPSPSTITAILHRYGCIDPEEGKKHTPFQRFEMERPNQLWQMDFKGYFRIAGQQCHPLTILDDHSRFLLGLKACQNQQGTTVRDHLTVVFRQYGMPDTFLVDNGVPWGPAYANRYYTRLNTWLFRLDIKVSHSRPYHPQTMGKDERLHRTLKAEVLKYQQFDDFPMCQRSFNIWRRVYNCERPHEALGMAVPVSRYRPSQRKFPEKLPPVTYPPQDQVRKVTHGGRISFGNRVFRVGKAFTGSHVAIRHTQIDGEYEVYFCKQMIRRLSLRDV